MKDMLLRGWLNLIERVGGPMTFRIILQPAMATILGVLGGIRDAHEGRPPYLRTLLTDPLQRANLFHQGWKAVGRVFLLALIMDIIYQWIVERWIYPLELLIVAILLAVVPYLLVRGPVNRIARHWLPKLNPVIKRQRTSSNSPREVIDVSVIGACPTGRPDPVTSDSTIPSASK